MGEHIFEIHIPRIISYNPFVLSQIKSDSVSSMVVRKRWGRKAWPVRYVNSIWTYPSTPNIHTGGLSHVHFSRLTPSRRATPVVGTFFTVAMPLPPWSCCPLRRCPVIISPFCKTSHWILWYFSLFIFHCEHKMCSCCVSSTTKL